MEHNKDNKTTTNAELKAKNQTKVVVNKNQAFSKTKDNKNDDKKARSFKKQNRQPRRDQNRDKFQSEFQEKVIDIARVTTVVKGGRRFSFSAYAVIGNKKGKVGFGHGKANEVQDAIKKAIKAAQNNIINVKIVNKSTVPHEIHEKFIASKVMLKPAPKGKGIIASGTVRAVVELAGYTDIYTKTYGSRNKANIAQTTIKALMKLRLPKEIAHLRDVNVDDLR